MPENHCGSCTLCCKVLGVEREDGTVLTEPDRWCGHCEPGRGCGIYADRPPICVEFECLWLLSQKRHADMPPMSASLRPDRCKAVQTSSQDGNAVVFHLDPDRPDAWKTGPLGVYIGRLRGNLPVVIKCGESRKFFTV